jgi:hypothetical protein
MELDMLIAFTIELRTKTRCTSSITPDVRLGWRRQGYELKQQIHPFRRSSGRYVYDRVRGAHVTAEVVFALAFAASLALAASQQTSPQN